jgi:polyisoprenyl-phosphate glycosyltransferase
VTEQVRGYVVVPAFNEEAGLPAFGRELARVLGGVATAEKLEFTILVVDDGSLDRTAETVERLAAEPQPAGVRFRVLSLARNFGHQGAVVAGLVEAAGDGAAFVITIDADGEQPVELVPSLVERWLEGADLVHTARRPHASLPGWKRSASNAYYRLLRRVGGVRIAPGMADFKLWDGGLLRELREFLPTCGSTRVFAAWLAPDAPVVGYDQRFVERRTSRFTARKMWSLALGGLVRYSDLPLRLATLVGVGAFVFAAGLSLFVLWAAATGRTVPGWSSLMIALSIFAGLQSLSLGILGEYLLRNTFRNALPAFVVKRRKRTPRAVRPSAGQENPGAAATRA